LKFRAELGRLAKHLFRHLKIDLRPNRRPDDLGRGADRDDLTEIHGDDILFFLPQGAIAPLWRRIRFMFS
jgi:hypothetical protein